MNEDEGSQAPAGFLARLGPGLVAVSLFAGLTFAACALTALTAPAGAAPLEQRPGFFAALGFVVAVVVSIVALLMRVLLGPTRSSRRSDIHHADDRH
jgi:heme/copper-type cytochrome/quinol oxidase subunit 2